MRDQTDLILLNILAKLEYEILDEITKNPNLSNDEVKDLLQIVKSLSDEINSKISILTKKS